MGESTSILELGPHFDLECTLVMFRDCITHPPAQQHGCDDNTLTRSVCGLTNGHKTPGKVVNTASMLQWVSQGHTHTHTMKTLAADDAAMAGKNEIKK